MKLKYLLITIIILSSFTMFSQEEEKKENPFSFKWDNGFKLESLDKQFRMKFGGRIMVDHAYFFQNSDLDENFGELETKSGTEIRRARFFMSGTVYSNVEFKLQVDFAGGVAILKDAYIGFKKVPVVGTIRIGNVKEPFRFDPLTSSKYITFMERVLATDFAHERNSGIIIFNDFFNKRFSAQAGAFRNSSFGNAIAANDGYIVTGRATGLLINKPDEHKILHLGVGFSHRVSDNHEFKISSRPEAHLGPKYINTGTIENIKHANLTNFEAVFIYKSFSFQGEYIIGVYDTMDFEPIDKYTFDSYYGQVSYFITGESKNYKGSYSGLGRVKPTKNFGSSGGAGAWEVAVRLSNSNLNSKDVFGGEQRDITLGVNWYVNPITRLMVNYDLVKVVDTGNAAVIQARMQIDF